MPAVQAAFGHTVTALVRVRADLSRQIETLQGELGEHFDRHRDVEIDRCQPGLGPVLAARVLAEFGAGPHRYLDVTARRDDAATSPITRAWGTRRVVLAGSTANKRWRDALDLHAFTALNSSPAARADSDAHRGRGATHHQALRALGNRLVGILHGCLRHRAHDNQATAWPLTNNADQAAA